MTSNTCTPGVRKVTPSPKKAMPPSSGRNVYGPREGEVEAHCAAAAALAAPNVLLAEESLRGLVMPLNEHFQGFCRDLYTECVQVVTAHAPLTLQTTMQAQSLAELKINSHNLDFGVDPANGPRVRHLGELNKWRNAVAHQKSGAPGESRR